jgi:hypothetical protein
MKCGGQLQLKVQPLQAPPVEAIDPEIAEKNDQLLRTAFPRRSLHMTPVMARRRRGLRLMVSGPEVRGHKVLTVLEPYSIKPENLGLNMEAESWWVVSHWLWYPRRQLPNVQVSGLLVCQGSPRQCSFMCDSESRALRVPDVASCTTRLVGTYAS